MIMWAERSVWSLNLLWSTLKIFHLCSQVWNIIRPFAILNSWSFKCADDKFELQNSCKFEPKIVLVLLHVGLLFGFHFAFNFIYTFWRVCLCFDTLCFMCLVSLFEKFVWVHLVAFLSFIDCFCFITSFYACVVLKSLYKDVKFELL